MIIEKLQVSDKGVTSGRVEEVLEHENWVKAGPVRAGFTIRHDETAIYLYFKVIENHVRAVNTGFNSPVYEDSCVEFFFSLYDDPGHYYNFEFNAIGAMLGGYGKDRHDREHLSENFLERILIMPSLGKNALGDIREPTTWTLQAVIPIQTLAFNNISSLSGKGGAANFYKCGDKLDHPHYLSWKPVKSEKPDFHQLQYFGEITFA